MAAAPATLVFQGSTGRVTVTDGRTATLDMGHRGHDMRVTAWIEGDAIHVRTPAEGERLVSAGDSLTLRCDQTILERTTQNGVIVMNQRACPDVHTVRVSIEPPGAPSPDAP